MYQYLVNRPFGFFFLTPPNENVPPGFFCLGTVRDILYMINQEVEKFRLRMPCTPYMIDTWKDDDQCVSRV